MGSIGSLGTDSIIVVHRDGVGYREYQQWMLILVGHVYPYIHPTILLVLPRLPSIDRVYQYQRRWYPLWMDIQEYQGTLQGEGECRYGVEVQGCGQIHYPTIPSYPLPPIPLLLPMNPYLPLPSTPSIGQVPLQGQESTRGWEGYSRVQRVRMVEYDSVVALYTHLYPYTYPIYTPTTIPYPSLWFPSQYIQYYRGVYGYPCIGRYVQQGYRVREAVIPCTYYPLPPSTYPPIPYTHRLPTSNPPSISPPTMVWYSYQGWQYWQRWTGIPRVYRRYQQVGIGIRLQVHLQPPCSDLQPTVLSLLSLLYTLPLPGVTLVTIEQSVQPGGESMEYQQVWILLLYNPSSRTRYYQEPPHLLVPYYYS